MTRSPQGEANLNAAADHYNTLDEVAARSFLRKIVLSAQHPDLVPFLEGFAEDIKARAMIRRTLN